MNGPEETPTTQDPNDDGDRIAGEDLDEMATGRTLFRRRRPSSSSTRTSSEPHLGGLLLLMKGGRDEGVSAEVCNPHYFADSR
jgi:hypothetical protein